MSQPSSQISPDCGFDQTQDRTAAGGLAAAGFADQRHRLADVDREAHVLDRMHFCDRPAEDAALTGKRVVRLLTSSKRRGSGRGRRCGPAARGIANPRIGSGATCRASRQVWGPRRAASGCSPPAGFEDLLDRALLNDPAAIHHHHAIRHLRNDRHVVGDEQHRHVVFAFQAVDQGENFGLDRHVQRGRRLVGDEQARLAGHRHGDDDALAHAAREFVRILLRGGVPARDAHPLEKLERLARALFAAAGRDGPCRPSTSCRSIVNTGLSEVIGSWKIMPISIAAELTHQFRRGLARGRSSAVRGVN